jgi:hypothetical protein
LQEARDGFHNRNFFALPNAAVASTIEPATTQKSRDFMNHHDAEMSEVVVVLDDLTDEQTQEVVKQLQAAGLQVSDVDNDQSTVDGTIDAQKVHDLKHVPHVRYVRSVMTYTADYPPGDPRDKDGAEDQLEDGDD